MNLKANFKVVNITSLLIALLSLMAIPQKALAGAFGGIRPITSNNIYQCSTGLSWELVIGNSNIRTTSAGFSMGCLNANGKAQWILGSGFICEGDLCKSAPVASYMNPPYDANSGTITRKVPTAVVGIDCELKPIGSRGDEKWICQRITSYENLKTVA